MQFRSGETPFYDPKTAPKTAQDRPNTAPRKSFFGFVFVSDFGAFWVLFWSHFGLQNRPKLEWSPGLVKVKTTKADPWAPKMPQEPPQTSLRPPKASQKTPEDAPNDQTSTQDTPKTTRNRSSQLSISYLYLISSPHLIQDHPRCIRELPRGVPDPPGGTEDPFNPMI